MTETTNLIYNVYFLGGKKKEELCLNCDVPLFAFRETKYCGDCLIVKLQAPERVRRYRPRLKKNNMV